MPVDLAQMISETGSDVRLRQGVAVADPASGIVTVRLGGSSDTLDNVPAFLIDSASVRNGNTVWILQTGGILLCLGPVSIAWPTYTPAFTASGGATSGGTIAGKYKLLTARTTIINAEITYTGGMGLPAGTYYLGFPTGITAASGSFAPGAAMYHTGAAPWAGTCSPFYSGAGGTKLAIAFDNAGLPWGQNSPVAAGVGHVITATWIGEVNG